MKKRFELTEKHKKRIAAVSVIILILVICLITAVVGRPMVRFFEEPEKFREWVDEQGGILGRVFFVLLVMVQVVVALIPGEPLEIGAGYAFGALEGTILCMVGITLGSLIVFFLVRRFGIKLVEVFFPIEKIRKLKFLQNSKRVELITFLVFFLPGTPKDLLSYFVGLTDIKLSKWIMIAAFARLPSIITSTLGGSALGTQQYMMAILVFVIAAVLSGAGILIYNFLQKRHEKKSALEKEKPHAGDGSS